MADTAGGASRDEELASNLAAMSALAVLMAPLGAGGTPLVVSGPHLRGASAADVERIQRFRDAQYRERLSYMLSPEQLQIDWRLQLDERSAHFGASWGERLVGSLRITPAPFEFHALAGSLEEQAPRFRGYAEFSRLVVDPDARSAYVTPRLLLAACTWAMQEGYVGIIGLCRRASRTVFERYGLTAASEEQHSVPLRGPQPYTLMMGTWPQLIAASTRLTQRLNRLQSKEASEAYAPLAEVEQT
ncbi:GNAT family N-acetyltransferase [Corallococcus carmarthensis]|uniref:GNAT family N-acetyltransferase n=1 Tax=Corallococcus carmarthensis TaxID=2316728 RepID=UPI00131557D2|nr:GNAT family N-acetyltransferase [Corallococcus carmarthensis]NOK22038.1 GNAT family N-acetyltransferase [Corallococcus carmarthensis]